MLVATVHRMDERRLTLRELNDKLRRSIPTVSDHGRLLLTREVQQLSPSCLAELLSVVRSFDSFNSDNDPYGEHDFGAVQIAGVTFFWKIDVYSDALVHAPSDADRSTIITRVLTIMHASEY